MRLRIISLSVMFGVIATAVSWITLQPALSNLLATVAKLATPDSPQLALAVRLKRVLPFYLALDAVVITVFVYLALEWMVSRPLRAAERSIEQLASSNPIVSLAQGGPLMARLQHALKRTADALQSEQTTTRTQLTELRSANDRLVRAQSELVASDRLATVGKLAAGVAHEVGNPLSGILGYLSLLRSRANGAEETLDLVTRIEAEVQRIDQIVRSLLELGRPSRGTPGPVALLPLVDSAVKLLASGPELRNVKISVAIDAAVYARAESGPLSQVVINLLINAAQAMGGQGAIDVAASATTEHVVLTVRDHGPGLPPDVRARLFEAFFTTKPAGKGTGLGLAVSRHLLAAMGGALTADNHSAGGAVFTITLANP